MIDLANQHGPICVPYTRYPHLPAIYGRFIVIDLDANNAASRAAWAKQHGREPRSFGWGVCRHGFGLQRDTYATEAEAVRVANTLNREQQRKLAGNVEDEQGGEDGR